MGVEVEIARPFDFRPNAASWPVRPLRHNLCVDVAIQEPTNHSLVLSAVFRGLGFEEVDTLLAQGKGDLDAFLSERQVGGRLAAPRASSAG